MLIRTFKRNAGVIPVLILVVGLLLWSDAFLFFDRLEPFNPDAGPLYSLISDFMQTHPLLNRVLAFLLLLVQVFFLNNIVQANSLLGRPSWLPGFMYLLLMSSHPQLLQFHPGLVANLFLITALARTLAAFSEGQAMVEVFNVGFLVAVAGLFYYPALGFFVWLILSMTVFFLIGIRGLAAAIMGFLSPFFFLFTVYYLTDRVEAGFEEMTSHFFILRILEYDFSLFSVLLSLFLALLALLSFLKVSLSYVNDKPIRVRKRFRVMWYFFITSLLSFLVVGENAEGHLALIMVPLGIVASLFLLEIRKKWLADLVLYGFMLLIVAGKVLLSPINQ